MATSEVTYLCPSCNQECFWFYEVDASFSTKANCDDCRQWLHKNVKISVGAFAAAGIKVNFYE